MGNTVRVGTQITGVSKASSDLDRLRDKFDKLQKTSGKSMLAGFVGGAGLGAIGLAGQAVGQLTDALGDSIQAARDEEVSIQKLGTSLKANVAAWDGNTDAIEKTLKARMALGFSDDEQRDSLSRIVVATKDVNKALLVQRTAMDLARLKGISLAEAGDALIKVEGGQFRALKALGIQLPKNATATEALAAVTKAAAGQAEDFAKTNEGKLLVSQVKVGEAMERFGGAALPLVVTGMEAAADAATTLSDVYGVLSGETKLTNDESVDLGARLLEMAGSLPFVGSGFSLLGETARDSLNDVASGADHSLDAIESLKGGAGSFGVLEDAATDWRDTYKDVAGATIRASHRVRDALVKDAAIVRGDVFDETEIRAELHDKRLDIFALEEQKRSAKTAEARRQASDDIMQALDDEGESLEELADKGKLTQKDVDRFTKDAKRNFASLSKEGRADIQTLINKYRALANMPNINKTFTVWKETRSGTPGHAPGHGATEFNADGGPVKKGTLTWVGEEGPELLEMGGDGFITPADMSARAVGTGGGSPVGGGGGITVIVNAGIGTTFTAAEGRRLADAIGPALYADMTRRGLLSRTATGLRG